MIGKPGLISGVVKVRAAGCCAGGLVHTYAVLMFCLG